MNRRLAVVASLTLAAVPVALAVPAEAAAPTASVGQSSYVIRYHGGSGANDLKITLIPDPKLANLYQVVLRDRVDIRAGSTCTYPEKGNRKLVWCTAALDFSDVSSLNVHLDAGNDKVTATGLGLETAIHGDGGNDRLTSASDALSLFGDDGNDVVDGGSRRDFVYGGRGNDLIRGGRDADKIFGNSGNDTLYGNSGNDTISGGPGRDKISGGPGIDKIKN